MTGETPSSADASQKTYLEEAREDLVEKVSVAGWKEALSERVVWIKAIFQVSLLVLSCCCIYYNVKSMLRYLNTSGFSNEIIDRTDEPSMPFSNVTVCAQVYFSKKYVMQSLTVIQQIFDEYAKSAKENTPNKFYEELTLFLSLITRPRRFSKLEMALFSKVVRMNPRLDDFSKFATLASLQCEQMFVRCWFNGRPFDCCSFAVQSIDEDGICYLITLNRDSDNAIPELGTFQQTQAGPRGGLTMELSVALDDYPWLESDAQNGFRVFVNAVPYSIFLSPSTAPHAAETYIKVVPSMNSLVTNCAGRDHVSKAQVEMAYLDPEGFNCLAEKFGPLLFKHANCEPIGFTYKPNSSVVCSPLMHYMITKAGTAEVSVAAFGEMDKSIGRTSVNAKRIQQFAKELEEESKSVKSGFSGGCPKHCHYWTYLAAASFIDLEKPVDPNSNRTSMYARIHVYYGDMAYREYAQTTEPTVYLAFCDFGNLIGLYWGMSIISIFHVLYYVPRFVYAREVTRNRRVAPM